jgi:hypothetical protein
MGRRPGTFALTSRFKRYATGADSRPAAPGQRAGLIDSALVAQIGNQV